MRRENLEGRINFRVTVEERQEIQEQAEASGLSVSEYVRRRALGRRVDSVMDVKMISELRRQGGLLKKIFNEANGMYSEEIEVTLENLNSFIKVLERSVFNDLENSFTTSRQ